MAKKIRKTQEEEITEVLKREGFKELDQKEIKKQPYKKIYTLPECIKEKRRIVNKRK